MMTEAPTARPSGHCSRSLSRIATEKRRVKAGLIVLEKLARLWIGFQFTQAMTAIMEGHLGRKPRAQVSNS